MTRLPALCSTILALAFCIFASDHAVARAEEAVPEGIRDVQILEGWQDQSGATIAAIRVELLPGWHTYWRVPGEIGIPPQFDWSGSSNLAALSYEWPRPGIYEEAGMRYFGYQDELTLPVRLVPKDPSDPIVVRLNLFLGVCKEICLPGNAEVSATLEPKAEAWEIREIRAALQRRALSADEAGVSLVKCSLAPTSRGLEISAEIEFESAPSSEQVALIESRDPALWIGSQQTAIDGNRLVARARVSGGSGDSVVIGREDIRLTVLDGSRAVDIPACIAQS